MGQVEEYRLQEQDERHPLVVGVVSDLVVFRVRADSGVRYLTLLQGGHVHVFRLSRDTHIRNFRPIRFRLRDSWPKCVLTTVYVDVKKQNESMTDGGTPRSVMHLEN